MPAKLRHQSDRELQEQKEQTRQLEAEKEAEAAAAERAEREKVRRGLCSRHSSSGVTGGRGGAAEEADQGAGSSDRSAARQSAGA